VWIDVLHGDGVRATVLSMSSTSLLPSLPATFTTATALSSGVHPRELYRWRDEGALVALSRGVFRRVDAPPASYPDLLAVAYRAPRAIVCCVSAAAIHDLADEMPVAVQIAVPTHDRPPQISQPPTEVFRFDASSFELGLSSVEAAKGEHVRIYDAARTVVDLMRLRHRLGEPLAHAALRRYLLRRDARPPALLRLAGELDVRGPVERALDVALAQ